MPGLDPSQLIINASFSIPVAELRFRFVRSRGPGGQHVNTSATQVELVFDVAHSPSLSEARRQIILSKLRNRIDSDGMLRIESQSTRSQLRNRQDVIARFQSLLREALKPRTKRRPTQPTAASRERRLENKKRRSATKRVRRSTDD
jgi:ribosome-associated protein